MKLKQYRFALVAVLLLCGMAWNAEAKKQKPTVYFIGDSTVRHGVKGDGSEEARWGWGAMTNTLFNTDKVNLDNRALGGMSSRTFYNQLWPCVIDDIKKGDYLFIQFGHNDGGSSYTGPRGKSSIRGNGEETVTAEENGRTETVHSFGWYIRAYITEAQAKGATVFVCSLIPRNNWNNGAMGRNTNDYALWAKEAAEQTGAYFIPLNDLCADFYTSVGQEKTTGFYYPANDYVHTTMEGAKQNARLVMGYVQEHFPKVKINKYLVKEKADDGKYPGMTAGMPTCTLAK